MFGLGKLWSAISRLVGSLNALADTVDEVNAGVRQRLYLDGPEPPDTQPEALEDHTTDVVDSPTNGKRSRKRQPAHA